MPPRGLLNLIVDGAVNARLGMARQPIGARQMKIEFDPANKAQLAAVACLIASLRGNSLAPSTPLASLDGDSEHLDTFDDEADPATAFDGPDAEQAFAAPVAATPPPPSPAPSTDAPAPGVNLDKSGLPWDARIHSSPPSTIKDGTWRRKRGLDEATEQAVIAELRQVMGAPAPAA